jgi:hypothetical protein
VQLLYNRFAIALRSLHIRFVPLLSPLLLHHHTNTHQHTNTRTHTITQRLRESGALPHVTDWGRFAFGLDVAEGEGEGEGESESESEGEGEGNGKGGGLNIDAR